MMKCLGWAMQALLRGVSAGEIVGEASDETTIRKPDLLLTLHLSS